MTPPTLESLKANLPKKLEVTVTPNASFARLTIFSLSEEKACLQVHVTAGAHDGEANAAVLLLLSKTLGVPKTSLVLARGEKSRKKTVEVVR